MAKAFDFQWRIPVPERLQKGDIFDRWDEVSLHNLHVVKTNQHCQLIKASVTNLLSTLLYPLKVL